MFKSTAPTSAFDYTMPASHVTLLSAFHNPSDSHPFTHDTSNPVWQFPAILTLPLKKHYSNEAQAEDTVCYLLGGGELFKSFLMGHIYKILKYSHGYAKETAKKTHQLQCTREHKRPLTIGSSYSHAIVCHSLM